MKKYRFLIITIMLLLLLTSCAGGARKTSRQAEAQRRLGEVYLAQGQYPAALKEFLEAEKINSDDPLLHDDLGRVFVAKKRYDLAIKHFKKAQKIRPDFAAGKNNLGAAYILNQEWDKAIDVFKELSENLLYATPHYAQYNLGWAYYNKGLHRQALKQYKRALELQPGFVLALRGMGLACLETGRLAEAITWFEKAAEKSPPFPQLYLDLGRAYVSARKYKKAGGAFDRVVNLAPETELAFDAKREKSKLASDGLLF